VRDRPAHPRIGGVPSSLPSFSSLDLVRPPPLTSADGSCHHLRRLVHLQADEQGSDRRLEKEAVSLS
jgi:hypothetical protein